MTWARQRICKLLLYHGHCSDLRQGANCMRLDLLAPGKGSRERLPGVAGPYGAKGRGWRGQWGIGVDAARKMLRGDLPPAAFCVTLVWAAISCPVNE